MNCDKILDDLYYNEAGFSFVKRVLIYFHSLHCPRCAAHRRALRVASDCMKDDFFPSAGNIAENIMSLIQAGDFTDDEVKRESMPFRAWIITGFAILVSLSSAYLGIDYLMPTSTHTVYFMLPLGITIGAVITAFAAIFIGCHITELSKWLGLRPRQ
ncbi:MAG: hypothetical protein LBJ35_04115 [Spirochaetaceae bacterium]|nr:hypothetical protein [Spirochaetaceae bacterium]